MHNQPLSTEWANELRVSLLSYSLGCPRFFPQNKESSLNRCVDHTKNNVKRLPMKNWQGWLTWKRSTKILTTLPTSSESRNCTNTLRAKALMRCQGQWYSSGPNMKRYTVSTRLWKDLKWCEGWWWMKLITSGTLAWFHWLHWQMEITECTWSWS